MREVTIGAALALACTALDVHAEEALPTPPAADPVATIPANSPADGESPPTAAAPATRKGSIGEIVVTAQKRAENLQDVPISITALSQEQMEERNIKNVNDIASQTPGFEYGEFLGSSQPSIRGVGFALIAGAGENSVAVHSDGVYIPRPEAVAMVSNDDFGGIEILRGPQGTLYGRNATGGVLNLISAPAPNETKAAISGQIGSYNQRRIGANVGSAFFGGSFRVRLSALQDDTKSDYFENVEFDDNDEGASNLKKARLTADWDPNESWSLSLRLMTSHVHLNGGHIEAYKPPANSFTAPPGTYTEDPYTFRNNSSGDTTNDFDLGSLKVAYHFNDAWSTSLLVGRSKFHQDVYDIDPDGTSNQIFDGDRFNRDETSTEELLLSFDGDSIKWTSGLYHLKETYDAYSIARINALFVVGLGVDLALNDVAPGVGTLFENLVVNTPLGEIPQGGLVFDSLEHTKSIAGFTDATWSLTDWFRLYGGARYTAEDKRQLLTDAVISVPANSGVDLCRDQVTKLHYNKVTGRAGVQFDMADDTMVYGQGSRGFKAGGFSIGSCDSAFDPEELTAYEVGIKSMWLDGSVRANGAAFRYKYDGLQVEEVVVPRININNADAKVSGGEVELLYVPVRQWEFSANAAYLDAKYTQFMNGDPSLTPVNVVVAPDQNLKGNRLNRAPEWVFGGAIQFAWDMTQWGHASLRVDGTWKDDYYLREFNLDTDKVSSHAIYNFFANYYTPGERFIVRGFVKNFTDKAVPSAMTSVLGYKAVGWNAPRLLGISLEYQFGN